MTRPPDKTLSEAELDALFQAAEAEAPLPSAALFSRALSDAEAVAAQDFAAEPVPDGGLAAPWFARIKRTLGGWSGMSGLAGAATAGLVIGSVSPDMFFEATELVFGPALGASDYLPSLPVVGFDE
ncbi:MAG: hypothetical protein AAFP13_03040 [Pseudomonadota bacterium]